MPDVPSDERSQRPTLSLSLATRSPHDPQKLTADTGHVATRSLLDARLHLNVLRFNSPLRLRPNTPPRHKPSEGAVTPGCYDASYGECVLGVYLAAHSTVRSTCMCMRAFACPVQSTCMCMRAFACPVCPHVPFTPCVYVSFVVVLRGCLPQCALCALRPSPGLRTARRHL